MGDLAMRECAGVANTLLRALGWEKKRYVNPLAVLSAVGFRVLVGTPTGCHAFLIEEDGELTVRVALGRTDLETHAIVAHEVGHFARDYAGHPIPQEEVTTGIVGELVQTPEQGLVDTWYGCGRDPERFCAAFPLVVPSQLFTRLAIALGGYAVVHSGKTERFVANDVEPVEPLERMMRRYALYEAVRFTGRASANDDGWFAAPVADPGEKPQIIVVVRASAAEP